MDWYKTVLAMAARTSPDVEQKIINTYESIKDNYSSPGRAATFIARDMDISRQTVLRTLHRHKIIEQPWVDQKPGVGKWESTKKRQEKALRMFQKGISIKQIAKELKVDIANVYRWIRIMTGRKNWENQNPEQLQQMVIDLFKDTSKKILSPADIAKQLNMPLSTVQFILKRHGLKRTPGEKSQMVSRRMLNWWDSQGGWYGYMLQLPEEQWLINITNYAKTLITQGASRQEASRAANSILSRLKRMKKEMIDEDKTDPNDVLPVYDYKNPPVLNEETGQYAVA